MARANCAHPGRDGPPDSGVRGRPNRKVRRHAEQDRTKAGRDFAFASWIGVGNTVWRIKRRPV
jgi:hypothetical protein